MRTSPLGMRRRPRRAPLLLLILLVALVAACSDDGDDEGTTPTTTAPTTGSTEAQDDSSTTTEAAEDATTSTEAPEGTIPATVSGDEADVLTAEQAEAQLDALVAVYRRGVAEAATAQALDERTLATFSGAFTGSRASTELSALQAAGVQLLNPRPPETAVADVEITSSGAGCAAGTASIEGLDGFVTVPVEVVQPYYFRLVPAAEGAAAPAWRLDFLNFSNDGVPLTEEATCG